MCSSCGLSRELAIIKPWKLENISLGNRVVQPWALAKDRAVASWYRRQLLASPTIIPQTVLALRGSHGVAIEWGYGSFPGPVARACALKCCKLQYTVDVTFAVLQPNGPFFHICCKLKYEINFFHSDAALAALGLRLHTPGF